MRFPLSKLLTRVCMVLVIMGGSMAFAQKGGGKFTIVRSTGPGITFTYEGRTFALKPGDTIPKGAVVKVPKGASLVVSPDTGVFMSVNSDSEVGFVSDEQLFSQHDPTSQILIDVVSGTVGVDTGSFLSPASRVAVNTPQGIFAANDASFTASTVTTTQDGVPTSVGGVQVATGNVTTTLPSGEELAVAAGRNLLASGTGENVTRAVSDGPLPDTLVGAVPGETQIGPGDSIVGIGNPSTLSPPDILTNQALADAVSPKIQSSLATVEQASIPTSVINLTSTSSSSSSEKVLGAGASSGMDGQPVPATAAQQLGPATNTSIMKSLATAGGIVPPVLVGNDAPPAPPPPAGPASLLTALNILSDVSTQLVSNDPSQTETIPSISPDSQASSISIPPISLTLLPTFTSPSTITGAVNQSLSYTFATTDPTAIITIQSSNLPTGLTLSGPTISGTPTVTGSNFTVTATAYNVAGSTAPFTLNISILPGAVPTVTLSGPTAQNSGTSYTYTLNVSGGTPPYTATASVSPIISSWFPSTVSINSFSATPPSTASYTGNPYTLTVAVTDATGARSTSTLEITVTATTPTITNGAGGTITYNDPTITGITGAVYTSETDSKLKSTDMVVSPALPSDVTAFDTTVNGLGQGGLYWPWSNSTLGSEALKGTLLQGVHLSPQGDIFAAYYVYNHYDTSGNYYANTSSIPTGQNYVTPGTYSGPGGSTLAGVTINF